MRSIVYFKCCCVSYSIYAQLGCYCATYTPCYATITPHLSDHLPPSGFTIHHYSAYGQSAEYNMTASLALPGEPETDFNINPPVWELLGEYVGRVEMVGFYGFM